MALVVLMMAQPRLAGEWSRLFGARSTHYVVLLDDSFSMSDSWERTSAFEQAKAVVSQIGKAVSDEGPQRFTLLRFSRAGGAAGSPQPDLSEKAVDADFAQRLDALVAPWAASETAAGPEEALDAVDELLSGSAATECIVYLVSDFRAREWEDPAEYLRDKLVEWKQAGRKVHLVDCVDAARPNLAIAELTAAPGTWASGVFSFMDVVVRNYGTKPVRDVAVLVEADGRAQPSVTIPQIPPQGSVRERFPVRFATAGEHRVVAHLEPDAVAADNARYAVLEVAAELPVLLVDGDPSGRDARFLAAVFAPGSPVATGISPKIETPAF